MQVIAVDTNVLISTLLGKSYPYLIIRELILRKQVINIISDEVFSEYVDVFSYRKFEKYKNFEEESLQLLEDIKNTSVVIKPSKQFKLLADESDNKFLDLVYSSNADFLVTGNSKHFPFATFKNTRIISPEKYWNTYWK